ncbi:MAG TPA: hypothetical protein VFH45_01750, partial [Acidimicrobiales bacterium]|nr:hypothetical protein [Acidimicrobiales bacterium]
MTAPAEVGVLVDASAGWQSARAAALDAVGSGAASIWVADVGAPVPTLAALAMEVSLAGLGLLVDPRRRPLTVLGKQLSSLDVVAGGRLRTAIDATGDPDGAEEAVVVLRGLLAGGPLTHSGPRATAEGARALPPSPQGDRVEMWLLGPPEVAGRAWG